MSSKVEDWFFDFVSLHLDRCRRPDLPDMSTDPGLVFWENWRRAFVRIGVTWDVADEASSIVASKDMFANQHLAAIMAEAERIFRERRTKETPGYTPGSREAAVAATPEDCECGRGGIVVRYRHEPAGKGTGHNSPGAAVNCYCPCPMGRWTKDRHDADARRCFIDLADRPDLQFRAVPWSDAPDNPFRYRPSQWDAATGQPRAVEAHYAADKDAMAKGIVRERRAPQKPTRAVVAYVEPTAEDVEKAERIRAAMRQQGQSGGK